LVGVVADSVGFVSLAVAALALSPALELLLALVDDECLLSVMYHPDPLKMMPAGVRIFLSVGCWHSGQSTNGAALTDCIFSMVAPQLRQVY
jgi:hypothetical protein